MPNEHVNKVILGTETLLDLTEDTAVAADVAAGKSFHLASGARTTGTASYAGAPTNNGNANTANAILYGTVDSTSTSTSYTATVAGLDQLVDGTCVMLHNGVVTSAAGFTVNINGLGAKKCYNNMTNATQDTTIFNINYTMLFIYSTALDEGDGGFWIYRGYNSDNNTIGYQLRTNATAMPTVTRTRYYRLLFTSADRTKWVPANTGYDNSATSKKTVSQNAIDPHGRIVYMTGTTNVNANANVGATVVWDRYTLNLGYSFNTTGAALTLTFPAPVFVKCAPQSNGSAIIDSTTPYVQALPSTADGKIYIYLGMAYSETNIELVDDHPVYWHDGTGIRIWTGAEPSSGGGTTTWYGTCNTSQATAEKAVVCEGFELSTGAIIGILFLIGNAAATPTLNVNSTGAKSIYVGSSTPSSTTNTLQWSNGTMCYFMYDGSGYRYMGSFVGGIQQQPRGAGTWFGFGSGTATSKAKSASISNFFLTTGALVTLKFTNANTYTDAALTLNISSTGASNIYYRGAVTSATNTLTWDANTTITFMYYSAQWHVISISPTQSGLPSVTSSDNGKVLQVVNGAWAAASLPSASGVSF